MPSKKDNFQNQPHAKALCGAKTRAGTPCKNAPMDNGRCRMHGGKSTGPNNQTKNKNAVKHALFAKYVPTETLEIAESITVADTLDVLWDQIRFAHAALIRAQRIMYVADIGDKTVERVGYSNSNVIGEKWEVQQAWDKQASFLKAQARAQGELRSLIKQYDDLISKDTAAITEEQRLRVAKLKVEVDAKERENSVVTSGPDYTGIPATMIAPTFAPVLFDIREQEYMEYVFPGGRGSTKSSFVSLSLIDLIMTNETTHAVVMRQVADTLRSSVYQQVLWAIDMLGLTETFHATVSPMEITRKDTGQKIYFRGADDPGKIKSIKVPFGHIGILWFEELDQFAGPEAVRKVEQSVIRGGDTAYIFKSYNPPKSSINWVNKYVQIPKANRLVAHSNYLEVPKKWLGKPFLEEAEFLKENNRLAYDNEYMGEVNGIGGLVFDNVVVREVTQEEILQFDAVLNGVDWGWFPDPYAFIRCQYQPGQSRLILFDEFGTNRLSNKDTAKILKTKHGITERDLITCDSAEPKSISDYKSYGLFARGAEKGPDSRRYSFKWLQSLREIVIDPVRCPKALEEFINYEYERDKDGNVLSGYPDINDHFIDAARYATERIWKRRGL